MHRLKETFIGGREDLTAVFVSLQALLGALLRSVDDPRLFYSIGPCPDVEGAAQLLHPTRL